MKINACARQRDHPRVCGEHFVHAVVEFLGAGSSPRMRGTLVLLSAAGELDGIIPAYAGNTHLAGLLVWCGGDHPRVCGEHILGDSNADIHKGSSPRMRGTRSVRRADGGDLGIIPAYAGNTTGGDTDSLKIRDHPRVCGEHRCGGCHMGGRRGSSPRMRGTLIERVPSVLYIGIIPAYAGNTLRDYSNFVVSKFMSFVFHLV